MKNLTHAVIALTAFGTGVSAQCDQLRSDTSLTSMQDGDAPDIVDVAVAAGKFKTLATALGAAGLVDTLKGKGPFTVFAPTDEAFGKLPRDLVARLLQPSSRQALAQILTYHVVPGRVSAAAAIQAGKAKTVQGSTLALRLKNGQLMAGPARVINNDIKAANGVIHVIDSVLVPEGALDSLRGPKDLIELAVERGAPLYNEGQRAACVAVYEVTTRALLYLDRNRLPAAAATALEAALKKASKEKDDVGRAWALRRGLDRAWKALGEAAPAPRRDSDSTRQAKAPQSSKVLFGFDGDPQDASWFSVNDDVMGGISKSRFEVTKRGTARFVGALSLENNGGFATVRSRSRDLGLEGWDGLRIRVRGDGRRYGLSALRSANRGDVRVWRRSFDTKKDEWTELDIPFSAMHLQIMGRRFAGRPVDPASIRSLSFIVADKNTDPFALEIDWIKAYRNQDASVASRS